MDGLNIRVKGVNWKTMASKALTQFIRQYGLDNGNVETLGSADLYNTMEKERYFRKNQ